MGGLFAELSQSKGLTPSRALQKSQGRLMNATKTAHPFFWGSFVVVGDGMGVVQQ
jgi:CHAT domain-containing protein